MTILHQHIFILYSHLSEIITNTQPITTQLCPDIEHSNIVTEQIFSIQQYLGHVHVKRMIIYLQLIKCCI